MMLKTIATDPEIARDLLDALESLPEAIAIFDSGDRFVYWNSRFEHLYGGAEMDLRLGTSFEEHLRRTVSAGRVSDALGREDDWVRERMDRFRQAEGVHVHQLGDGRWVRVQDRALANGGRVGIRTDVTDLVTREASFRLLFEVNQTAMFLLDRETLQMIDVNESALRLYGYTREAFLGLKLTDIRPETKPGQIAAMIDRLHEPEIALIPRIHFTVDGTELTVRVYGSVMEYKGRPTVLAAIFDLTDEIKLQEEVRLSREFLRSVVSHLPTAIFVKDMQDDGRYVLGNTAMERLFGHPENTLLGKRDADLLDPALVEQITGYDRKALHTPAGTVEDETVVYPDGTERLVRIKRTGFPTGDDPRYVIGIAEDITEQRASEARIAFMAHHDALTAMPNRYLFNDRLQGALTRLSGSSELLAVMIIDLDGFKAVNDRLGHPVGDELLKAVALRIAACLRRTDSAARLGGDEFVVLMAPVEQVGEVAWMAAKLHSQLAFPFWVDGQMLTISASIGISVAPLAGQTGTELFAAADAALYQAKREGKSCYRFAGDSASSRLDDRIVREG